MKKYILLLAVVVVALSSCKTTALVVPTEPQKKFGTFGTERMEFIGFKNINRNNLFIKDYGQDLERAHIAINKQDYYMGIYSLQELAAYKSTKRYIAFVDGIKHQYTYNDAISDKPGLEAGGWVVAGLTVFTLFPVYLPMICCANKNECQMSINGEYVLYVYDTQKKEVALTIPMNINVSEKYEGQYLNDATNKLDVQSRYKTMLFNLWNENFAKAYKFIEDLGK